MSVLLLVMSCDRDEYLAQTIAAFEDTVRGPITHRVIHDDSGNARHCAKLRKLYPAYKVVTNGQTRSKRSGFAGAIRSAWSQIATMGDYEWVFHLEDDFAFQRHVDLEDIITILVHQPHLAQMAFRRQPWYTGAEEEAGGWCELRRAEVEAHGLFGHEWLVHDGIFTTNPSLYRRGVTKLWWPEGKGSEDRFWLRLKDLGLPWGIAGADVRSAFWGGMESGARWVEHIGVERPAGAHTY